MKKIFLFLGIVIIFLLVFSSVLFAEGNKDHIMIKITKFQDNSQLKEAGAEVGDIIFKYNGVEIESVEHLAKLKQQAKTDSINVVLLREDKEVPITIKKGSLGVYLEIKVPDHKVDPDAVIIDGIGKLGWGKGMDISFLACICLLEEKYGDKLCYRDILGLSGYGFRVNFHEDICPSSPDPTCGKTIGMDILNDLGYVTTFYHLKQDGVEKEDGVEWRTEQEMRDLIKTSIDNGWVVIAIDLIQIPEWGLITGYQKDGNELFCRTYFDQTEGYEIAQKFPWVIGVIKEKKDVDINPLYKQSLHVAKEMYDTEKYEGVYYSGIAGLKKWIEVLKDDMKFEGADKNQLTEYVHANWWIYISLLDARFINSEYLKENQNKFGMDEKKIKKLARWMKRENDILSNGLEEIPKPYGNNQSITWTSQQRQAQIQTLEKLLKIEKKVQSHLEAVN